MMNLEITQLYAVLGKITSPLNHIKMKEWNVIPDMEQKFSSCRTLKQVNWFLHSKQEMLNRKSTKSSRFRLHNRSIKPNTHPQNLPFQTIEYTVIST